MRGALITRIGCGVYSTMLISHVSLRPKLATTMATVGFQLRFTVPKTNA